tara:strand:+ start:100 stop:528 length:429 start_codon:yes stop_codon:yes gene_type:complete
MRLLATMTLAMLATTSCTLKQWYPAIGATTAGAAGAALGGGPLIVGLAAGGGALAGEVSRGNEAVAEAHETIRALSSGDVEALVSRGLASQKGIIEKATDTIWTILKVAALCILGVLSIPLFITRSNTKKLNKICEKNDKVT